MSRVFEDDSIDVVKMTLTSKLDGTTTDIYLAADYYAAEELYSGSPEVYPMLAALPTSQRGIGRNMGLRFDVNIQVYALTDFQNAGVSFLDWLDDYETFGAPVEIRCYWKPRRAATTHATATNVRQTLTCTGFTISDGVANFACEDRWFDDKEVFRRVLQSDFSTLPDEYDGFYGAIPFGNDVIIDALPFDNSTGNELNLFCGWATSSNNVGDVLDMYVRNPFPQLSGDTWLPFSFETGDFLSGAEGRIYGESSTSITGYGVRYSLQINRGLPIDRSDTIILAGTRIEMTQGATAGGPIAEGDGKLSCRVIEINQDNEWYEVGNILGEVPIDAVNLPTSGAALNSEAVTFNPPVVLPGGKKYMIQWVWTNGDDTWFPYVRYKASSGDVFYERDINALTGSRGNSWYGISDQLLHAAMYAMVAEADVDTSVGTKYYKSKKMVEVPGLGSENWESIAFKVKVYGLEDDGSGTITGGANTVMARAAWVAHFLLRDSVYGLGVDSGNIDTSAFTSVATSQVNSLGGLGFAITAPRLVSEILEDLMFQSRSVFYKKRDGTLTVKFPEYDFASTDYGLDEEFFGDGVTFINLIDNPPDTVINDVFVEYNEDILQYRDNVELARRTGSTRYRSFYELNDSTSTGDDTARIAAAVDSVAKYGRRPFRVQLSQYATEQAAEVFTHYYFDRYSTLQKRFTIRIDRKRFNAIDLFDTITLSSFDLGSAGGTSEKVPVSDDGDPIFTYRDGLPLNVVRMGQIQGEIVEIIEYGPWMEITVETVSPY